MHVRFACHDIAAIQFHNVPEEIYTQLVQIFPSYVGGVADAEASAEPVTIEFVSGLALPEGARYISSTAAYSGTSYYLTDRRGSLIRIDLSSLGSPWHFQVSQRIDWGLLEDFIEILLHTLALDRQKSFFHSGAVGVDKQAVVLCGWANIGKTESIVEFLRRGYAYIGDDWTIIDANATVYSYEKAIAMYPHDIAVSPEAVQSYYGRFKGRILARYCHLHQPGKVGCVPLGLRESVERRLLRELVRRLHLHMTIHVKAEQISPRGTLRVAPLKALYFMTRANVPEVAITSLRSDELVARMLSCYCYATRLFFDSEALRFAFPSQNFDLGLGIRVADVESILSKAFLRPQVKLFTVQIPAATGPRELVSSLEAHMGQCCG